MHTLLPGLLFAALWASASVATKFGVQSADPLIMANIRFLIAGSVMGAFVYGIRRNPLPTGAEWRQLAIFAFLNTTIYLGCFVLAMKQVAAGIGSLSTATNPLFITMLSALWLRRPMRWYEWTGIVLGMGGVLLASYPLLQNSYATVEGLVILLISMFSISVATVYYAQIEWRLPTLVINTWQVVIGGLLLLPFTLLFADASTSQYDARFWLSVLWLVFLVSVAALQLWFFLVKHDAVKASLWLFLCPIFGFLFSAYFLNEPITVHTYLGTGLVLAGLYLAQRDKFTNT